MDPLAATFERFRREGDLQALGEVFDATAPRLLAIAMHLCGNPADAEDALQQTFVLAMQRAAAFDPTRPLAPWLAGLLTNVANNARRHAGRRRMEPLGDLPGDDEAPIAAAERVELLGQLRTRIDELPPEQRQALLLQLQHGLGAVEIAEVLQVPPGTVRMRLHRGIQALRRTLPAGLAMAVLAALPSRGLAAVRQGVLQVGGELVATALPSGLASGVLGGVLLMKKVLFAALALLVLGLGWWLQRPPTEPMAVRRAAGVSADAAHEAMLTAEPMAAPQRDSVTAEQRETVLARGSLRIRVVAERRDGGRDHAESIPVGGAALQVWPGTSALAPFSDAPRHVTTDVTGEVEVADLDPGPWQVVLLVDAGEPHAAFVTAGEVSSLEFTRVTQQIVRGVVVDAVGVAVAGADVWVYRGTAMGRYSLAEPKQLEVRRAATSDAEGRFVVALGAREGRFGASARGHGASFGQHVYEAGEELRLVLGTEHGSLGGAVRDSMGRPVVGALVEVIPAGQDQHRTADGTLLAARVPMQVRADAHGCFLFEGLPPGMTKYWVSAEPHYPKWGEVVVTAFSRTEVDVMLPAGITVVGTVRLADGTPARVAMAARPKLDPNGHYTQCDTREDGSYRLGWIPERTFFVTAGGRWGGFLAHREFQKPTPGVLQCDFVLDELGMLPGRVLDPTGAPLVGWQVQARAGPGNRGASSRTDREGRFALMVAKVGTLRVIAFAPDGDPDLPAVTSDDVHLGSAPLVMQVAAEAMPNAVVRGRLVDAQRRGVSAREVVLRLAEYADSGGRKTTTAADGTFAFASLSGAEFVVLLPEIESFCPSLATADLRGHQLVDLGDLVVPTPAMLRITVQRSDGSPWRGPLPGMRLCDREGKAVWARAQANMLEVQVAGGSYELEVGGVDLIAPRQTIDLPLGEQRDVSVKVGFGRTRQLVFNGDGRDKPDHGTKLHLTVRRGDGTVEVETDRADLMPNLRGFREWWFRHAFAFGDYVVEAHTDTGLRYRAAFTVREELTDPVRVDVPFALQ